MRRNGAGRAHTMRHLRTSAALALSLLLTGCNDTAGPVLDVAGTYELVIYEGQAMPVVVIERSDYRLEYTAGELLLRPDSTYWLQDLATQTTFPGNATVPIWSQTEGPYTLEGNYLTLLRKDGATLEGPANRRRLTLTLETADQQVQFVYERVTP